MSGGTVTVPRGAAARAVTRWHAGEAESRRDLLAEEVPVAIVCNGEPFAVMLATPADLEDFARGFALTERLVDTPDQIGAITVSTQLDGIELALTLAPECVARIATRERAFEGRSGCGVCGSRRIEEVLALPSPLRGGVAIAAASVHAALRALAPEQPLNAATGATHAAAWCDRDGAILLVREDVGRHNALDKLIGALVAASTDRSEGFVLLTSRASYEMVLKAARVGIGLVVAVSAPTALAVSLADSCGATLIGFARGADCTVYTHPWRYLTP